MNRRKRRESAEDPVVRASELAAYAYCARAWWLGHVQGVPPSETARLEAGTRFHRKHGWGAAQSVWAWRLALFFFALALLAALLALLTLG